jgi:chromosome partitioning protein
MQRIRDRIPLKGVKMSAKIITVANQKGGVGKTTTTMNLGAALAESGHRVLLIDSDPQANLTSYLGVQPGEGDHSGLLTLDQVYLSKRPMDRSMIASFIAICPENKNLHLIASDRGLSGVEYYLFSRPDRELLLSRVLDTLKADYDFILIDTPPSLNLLTMNALCASDHVLIPVQPEFFSLEGIVKIRESIESVRERWNQKLTILGVLATQVSHRRKLTEEVLGALKQEMGEEFFAAMIHDNAAVTESSGHAQSVLAYDRGSRGAKDYLAASKELQNKLGLSS